MSALAETPWCFCLACLGTPEVFTLCVMQLAALLGFPCWLTQVDCFTPAVMVSLGVGGLSCHSCTVPLPCFLFCACAASPSAASPSGFCPLQGGLACLSPVCWSTLWCGWRGLAATFSSVPVRCIVFSRLLLLRLLTGAVVALHPVSWCSSCGVVCLVCRWGSLLPSPYLRWVYFWLRCLQSLWATKAVSAALHGSSSSSGVCWSISFSGVGVVFGHAFVAPPATPGFGLF